MGQIFLIILIFIVLLLWGLYKFFSPVIKVYRQMFGAGRNRPGDGAGSGRRDREDTGAPKDAAEEQSSVDLIHETNMDLEGGEYVDYEEVK
ncbi:MAG: DUF4834 family protein [Porphyromonas sp.]|nr:DUF4834 family protein [Bacteroidales bacterium]MDY3100607.1 DUF4834 family protein [Porphyromonas sp.]